MILKRIFSRPSGLFEEVNFRKGMNIIFGKKDPDDPKDSLNSIGKSTFLDILDFALLAQYTKSQNKRLYAANEILLPYTIVLEFEINGVDYRIIRSFENAKDVYFGRDKDLSLYTLKSLRSEIAKLVFKRDNYDGHFSAEWFRTLLNFYLKIQKYQQEKFLDPIKFVRNQVPEYIQVVYNLYLMGIDNSLSYENMKSLSDLKKIDPTIKEVTSFVKNKYDLVDLKGATNEVSRLRLDIKRLRTSIDDFKLAEEYGDIENRANKLTEQIKDLWFNNFSDKKLKESYEESFAIPEKVALIKIRNLYNEVSEGLGLIVKATLEDAVKFRKELSKSRKDFLATEIAKLQEIIEERKDRINVLEEERARLFKFLASREAINDLSEAFFNLSEKQSKLSELEGSTKILTDLMIEKAEIQTEIAKLDSQIISFVDTSQQEIQAFYEIFIDVFESIYNKQDDTTNFSISHNSKKDSKIDISITYPDMFGKGKNQGRTLVYDLAILLKNITETVNFPRFLVHDGIFDGMDKAHFLSVFKLVENSVLEGRDVQYITTINEEGTLSEKFGPADRFSPQQLEKEAILVLSPSNKLFKRDFTA